jgi:hypothetical protein
VRDEVDVVRRVEVDAAESLQHLAEDVPGAD